MVWDARTRSAAARTRVGPITTRTSGCALGCVAIAAVVTLVAGCGGSSSSPATNSAQAGKTSTSAISQRVPADTPHAAYSAFIRAYLSGDAQTMCSRKTDAEKASVLVKYGATMGVTGATCESVIRSASPLVATVIGPDQILKLTKVVYIGVCP